MNETYPEHENFFKYADKFIAIANELSKELPTERISAIMLYAASRYNAFNAHLLDSEIMGNKEASIAYFLKQYESMLRENMDDFIKRKS